MICGDHPRLRGEHRNMKHFQCGKVGSPPPTRGTLKICIAHSVKCRITPAYAGNTLRKGEKEMGYKDHPRLRGEHGFITSQRLNSLGSPPPTRGTRDGGLTHTVLSGITPAYAGNTEVYHIRYA